MFIHFANDQILKLYGLPDRFGNADLSAHISRLLWSAALFSDGPVIVPTVDVVQSPVTPRLAASLKSLADVGLVELVGSTVNIDEFMTRKQIHYRGTGLHQEWSMPETISVLDGLQSSMNIRTINTTFDMLERWTGDMVDLADAQAYNRGTKKFAQGQLAQAYSLMPSKPRWTKFVDRGVSLPERLGDHAFLWSVVQKVDAFKLKTPGPVQAPLERVLAYYWTFSHIAEYNTNIIGHDGIMGWLDCGIRHTHPESVFDLVAFTSLLRRVGLDKLLDPTSIDDLLALKLDPIALTAISSVILPWFHELKSHSGRQIETEAKVRAITRFVNLHAHADRSWQDSRRRIFDAILTSADGVPVPRGRLYPFRSNQGDSGMTSLSINQAKVFIGHGHSLVWMQLRDFLKDRLGLEWDEFNRIPVAGLTALQRLQQMLDTSSFAFIIFTGDDETKDGVPQARQNAVHELGLFQGRLGFDRAVVLLEEGCAEFSNIAGLQQMRFPVNNIMAISEDIRRVLEDRLIG